MAECAAGIKRHRITCSLNGVREQTVRERLFASLTNISMSLRGAASKQTRWQLRPYLLLTRVGLWASVFGSNDVVRGELYVRYTHNHHFANSHSFVSDRLRRHVTAVKQLTPKNLTNHCPLIHRRSFYSVRRSARRRLYVMGQTPDTANR